MCWQLNPARRNMQKAQRTQYWTLLLLGTLIVSFMVMISYWCLVPDRIHFWPWFSHGDNGRGTSGDEPTAAELKFFMPPQTVPKELKLKRGAPFLYQILH